MAEQKGRLYVVAEVMDKGDPVERLVQANSQSQAISHVVKGRFSAEAAKATDVARLMTAGVLVQEAGAD